MNAGGAPVFILGGTVKAAMDWARKRGISHPVAVTETSQLVDFGGSQLIVLPGYIRAPRHVEVLVAARKYGLEVWWESDGDGSLA